MDELNRAKINQASSSVESLHPSPKPYFCYLDQHNTSENQAVSFSDSNLTYSKVTLSTSRQLLHELLQDLQ